jgi:hypothetical protein
MKRALGTGAGIWVLAAIAAGALAWLAYTAGRAPDTSVRGYAAFVANRDACYVSPGMTLNALGCRNIAEGEYAIDFSQDLQGSVAVASPAPCCPNSVGAEVSGTREVTVRFFGRPHYPVLVNVLVP